MAYYKANLKSSGDRASSCFKPFLIGNLSDTFSPTRILLYVSVRLIFINLTSFNYKQRQNDSEIKIYLLLDGISNYRQRYWFVYTSLLLTYSFRFVKQIKAESEF